MIKGIWMHLISIWSVRAKALKTIIDARYLSFSFLISLVKFLETYFHFVIMWYSVSIGDNFKKKFNPF